ncbi:nuclear transport factor 2 family protein [Frankia nepalensis]|nr:nuclear transport factor 2 family protein [Frankia nepalensis]
MAGMVPAFDEVARRLACADVVLEIFRSFDAHDIDGALEFYADDAVFLGVTGREAIKEKMRAGLAPNAARRSRHVIGNLQASALDSRVMLVRYTAVTHTLDGPGPYPPRSVLDQEQEHRCEPDGTMRVIRHHILWP